VRREVQDVRVREVEGLELPELREAVEIGVGTVREAKRTAAWTMISTVPCCDRGSWSKRWHQSPNVGDCAAAGDATAAKSTAHAARRALKLTLRR
jgi:hypothetical protein